jgi:hypothetical protein
MRIDKKNSAGERIGVIYICDSCKKNPLSVIQNAQYAKKISVIAVVLMALQTLCIPVNGIVLFVLKLKTNI